MSIIERLAFLLLALLGFAAPAQADDISAAGRSVVRVVVIAFEDGQVVDFSHGSGFAVAPNRIVTNAHVVALGRQYPDHYTIGVVPSEGEQSYGARLVAFDQAKDLALLELTEGRVTPIPLYMGPVGDGAAVVALGYPGNVDLATVQSAEDYITPAAPARSEGNYSNERRIAGVTALLHTASVARGNSGGPLLDPCGRVIGVNSFITQGQDGDSPFGFAISNRELAAFLRAAQQPFAQVSGECVSMTDRLRDEAARSAIEESESRRAAIDAADRAAREARFQATADVQNARENRAAIALLLGALGLIAAGAGGLMYQKDRLKPAYGLGGGGLLLIAIGAVVFFTRPALTAPPQEDEAPLTQAAATGPYLCRIVEDRSRVTVSATDDVAIDWSNGGCVNGRTQYARRGADGWSRILVPNDEATVSVAEFRPARGEYLVSRYLLGAAEMTRARALRSEIEIDACTTDENALALLADRQDMIRAALPRVPNERLVYSCRASMAR